MRHALGLTFGLLAMAGVSLAQYPPFFPGQPNGSPYGLIYPPPNYGPTNPGFPPIGGPPAQNPGQLRITQLRNRQSGEFLYTNDFHEVDALSRSGLYEVQGTPFSVLTRRGSNTRPLVRYVRENGTHFLATSRQPARPEITLGYVSTRPFAGSVPLITWHHPQASLDFYTTDPNNNQPAFQGFQRADVLGYVLP